MQRTWVLHRADALWMQTRGDEVLLASEVAGFATGRRTREDVGPIALLRYGTDGSHVSVLPRPGAAEEAVYRSANLVTSLVWHPSGTAVAFVESEDDGSSALLVTGVERGAAERVSLPPRHAYAQPSWSDDGVSFVVEGQPIDELRGMTIFGGPAGGAVEVVDPLEAPLPKCAAPQFAPDSSEVVYTYTDVGAVDSQLRTYDVRRRGERRIMGGGGLNVPRWSSDGRFIVAARHTTICETELVRIRARTTDLEVLIESGSHLLPVWASSDEVAYIARSCATSEDIPDTPGELRLLDLKRGQDVVVGTQIIGAALLS